MAIQAIPTLPVFAAYAKSKMPQISDPEILKLYDAYSRDADAQEEPAQRAPAQPAALAPVQPAAPVPNNTLPTTLDPFKGTTQAAANPAAPNASAISQFDPAARDAALEEYKRLYDQSAPVREQSMQRAAVAAVGSPAAGQLARESWLDLDKENLRRSIDQQVGKEAQATAGQAALTSAQAREEAAGKFTGTQREQEQKLQLGQFNVEQQKRLNDPLSAETRAAKSLLLSQIANIPDAAKAELKTILADPNVTAVSLLPILKEYAPAAHKAYLDQIGAGKTEAETAKAATEAAGMKQSQDMIARGRQLPPTPNYLPGQGTPQPFAAPPVTSAPAGPEPTFNFKDGANLGVYRAAIAKSNPENLAAFDKQFPNVAGNKQPVVSTPTNYYNTWESKFGPKPTEDDINPLEISSVSGTSGATMGQQPELGAKRDAGAKLVTANGQFIQAYDRTAAPAVRNAYANADELGGAKGENVANLKNRPDVLTFKNDVNKLNQLGIELGIVAGGDSKVVQSAIGSLGAGISAMGGPGIPIGTVVAAAAPFAGSSQPITNTSDPAAIKDLATKIAIIKAQTQKMLPYMQEYGTATRHGMMDRFSQTPVYKDIMNSIPVQNPKTGEIVLINPKDPSDMKEAERLKQQGWEPRKGYTNNVR